MHTAHHCIYSSVPSFFFYGQLKFLFSESFWPKRRSDSSFLDSEIKSVQPACIQVSGTDISCASIF